MCRPYVERTSFVVRTDHQALRWLFSTSSTDGNPRIVRWKLALAGFDFTVEYTPGSKNKVPDELSRMETTGLSPALRRRCGDRVDPLFAHPGKYSDGSGYAGISPIGTSGTSTRAYSGYIGR